MPTRYPSSDSAPLPNALFRDDPRTLCQLLSTAPLFHNFPVETLARFLPGTKSLTFHKGEILFHRGEACHGFYILVEGQVKLLFISSEGHEKVIEILRPGMSFGEAVMFLEKPFVVSAQALTPVELLFIHKDVVFDEMARDPVFSRRIAANLSFRLHQLILDVETYSLRSGRDRIIGYLLREESLQESDTGPFHGAVTVRLSATKGTIASRLNLTQEHFSRILNELTQQNLITVSGRMIHVHDIDRLRQSLS